MCTLMMLKGWHLRYNSYGRNSTYCPEETEEFMKQRRRWLLSDFANAIVVARNISKRILTLGKLTIKSKTINTKMPQNFSILSHIFTVTVYLSVLSFYSTGTHALE